jgi:hypothetical protein
MEKIKVLRKIDLEVEIEAAIKTHGPYCSLNHIDVSQLNDFSMLFFDLDFNGDISQWDVSSGEDFRRMFKWSSFNGDISQWKVDTNADVLFMFNESAFRGDLEPWRWHEERFLQAFFRPESLATYKNHRNSIEEKRSLENGFLKGAQLEKRKVFL